MHNWCRWETRTSNQLVLLYCWDVFVEGRMPYAIYIHRCQLCRLFANTEGSVQRCSSSFDLASVRRLFCWQLVPEMSVASICRAPSCVGGFHRPNLKRLGRERYKQQKNNLLSYFLSALTNIWWASFDSTTPGPKRSDKAEVMSSIWENTQFPGWKCPLRHTFTSQLAIHVVRAFVKISLRF